MAGGLATPRAQTLKKKKKSLAFGGGRTTPKDHGVASATHDRPIWDGQSQPMATRGGLATPNAQTKKKKNCQQGWLDHP
jgi:hypothetical protein